MLEPEHSPASISVIIGAGPPTDCKNFVSTKVWSDDFLI